jgi:hypothetical protein
VWNRRCCRHATGLPLRLRGTDGPGVPRLRQLGHRRPGGKRQCSFCHREVGAASKPTKTTNLLGLTGGVAVGHTRWATHGKVCEGNTHPIEGRLSPARWLERHLSPLHLLGRPQRHHRERAGAEAQAAGARPHLFSSDTDTEVLVHLIEDIFNTGVSDNGGRAGKLERAVEAALQHDRGDVRHRRDLVEGPGEDRGRAARQPAAGRRGRERLDLRGQRRGGRDRPHPATSSTWTTATW